MKCPNCNEEIEIMCETAVGNNTLEVIGMCENCLYDGTWFIEKDEKGNCLDLDTITAYKKKMMKKLSSFTPSCSAIVETYNGLQCYWFSSDNPTETQWRKVEKYLIDKLCINK